MGILYHLLQVIEVEDRPGGAVIFWTQEDVHHKLVWIIRHQAQGLLVQNCGYHEHFVRVEVWIEAI